MENVTIFWVIMGLLATGAFGLLWKFFTADWADGLAKKLLVGVIIIAAAWFCLIFPPATLIVIIIGAIFAIKRR